MTGAVVVDNSVVMAWCFRDEGTAFTRAVLAAVVERFALDLNGWPLEAGNTILVAERRKRIEPEEVSGLLAMLEELPFQVEQEPPSRMLKEIFALAREHQLSTYDASYLDLALRRGIPLATQDKSLHRAAAKCGVALFKP